MRFDDSSREPTTREVRRFDLQPLSKPTRTREGFLRTSGRLTRTGVFEYQDGRGGVRRELRRAQDVFEPASMESFALVPLTNGHPPDNLTPETARGATVGSVGHPRRVDSHVVADILVTDADAIRDIESGRRGLSAGYTLLLVEQPGTFRTDSGEEVHFDAIQTSIRGNHIALVDSPRAGPTAQLRADEGDWICVHPDPSPAEAGGNPNNHQELRADGGETSMRKIKLGGREFEASEELVDAILASQKRADDALAQARTDHSKELEAEKGKLAVAEAERASLKTKLSEAEKRADESDHEAAAERIRVIMAAAPIVKAKVEDLLKKDLNEVRKDALGALQPKLSLEGKDEGYITAAFDYAMSSRVDTAAEINKIVPDPKETSRGDESDGVKKIEEARERMKKRDADRWKIAQKDGGDS